MPNKELGIADPVYDALRIRSGQSIAPDLGGGSTGTGGIENKIYVWHADGSSIDAFNPDAAGLALAIAAAATGDTIWLPSIPIALTAAITIPANVALRGISHKAILNFTGFSTAAIVLSANSVIQDFTLNHTDGLWFSAAADGAKALRIHGTADYATTGIITYPLVSEIWIATDANIYYRTLAGNWTAVASLPNGDPITRIYITNDGALLYVFTNANRIYKCANPKAGSPSWSLILQGGDSAAGSTISTYFGYTMGPVQLRGSNLYTMVHLAASSSAWGYGVYNGSAWSWVRTTDYNQTDPCGVGSGFYGMNNQHIRDASNTLIEGFVPGVTFGYEFYVSKSGTGYIVRRASSTLYIHQIAGSDLVTLGSSSNTSENITTKISGAENGNQVHCVSAASGALGHLWIADDGAAFTDVATWQPGFARDESYNGGGTLIWLRGACSSGDEMIRRYARDGASNTNLTGNFWSLTTGSKTFVGLGLVYV